MLYDFIFAFCCWLYLCLEIRYLECLFFRGLLLRVSGFCVLLARPLACSREHPRTCPRVRTMNRSIRDLASRRVYHQRLLEIEDHL